MIISTFILSFFYGAGLILLIDACAMNIVKDLLPTPNLIELMPSIICTLAGLFLWMIPPENLIDDDDNPRIVQKNRFYMISSLIHILFSIMLSFYYFSSSFNKSKEQVPWYVRLLNPTKKEVDPNFYLKQLIACVFFSITFCSVFISGLLEKNKNL